MNDEGLTQAVLYNPRQLRAETLKAVFAARRPLLERLLADLGSQRPSHKLLVGTRGMGKTTLLHRLALAIAEDKKLGRRWIALSFPEEQYNVGSLGEFYLNCLDALADYLEKHTSHDDAEQVDAVVQSLRSLGDDELAAAGETALRKQAEKCSRNFVLLVDNLSILFDRLNDQEKWRLREFLSQGKSPVLIGASSEFVDDVADHGKAFYEFLQVHELTGCNNEEAEAVLRQLAETFKQPKVIAWLDADPARLATLNRLAGGAPRTLVMLFQLLVQGPEGNVMDELERLLDLATPLYKARLEELPEQSQRVIDALSLHWDPATRRDLEQVLRIEGNAISSQLNRLTKLGFVEQVDLPHEARAGYQIAERFFNIWYLMRTSRRMRHQLRWLVEFLRAFYSDGELVDMARTAICDDRYGRCNPMRHAQRLLAYRQAIRDEEFQKELEQVAFYTLAKADEDYSDSLDLSDVHRDWHEKIMALKDVIKQEAAIQEELAKNPGNAHAHYLLGTLYADNAKNYHKAEEEFRMAIDLDAELMHAWHSLARVIGRVESNYVEAEAAYLRASELAPKWGLIWVQLGNLYMRTRRFAEAKRSFKRAVEIDPNAFYWSCLGEFLEASGELDDALVAHEQAVKLEPERHTYWIYLGEAYARAFRIRDAEKALRKAVRLAPEHAFGRMVLAMFLANQRRHRESEREFRKAISLNPNYSNAKHIFADTLLSWDRHLEEAEQLAAAAFEKRPHFFGPFLLARILARRGDVTQGANLLAKYFQRSPRELFDDPTDVFLFFRELTWQGQGSVAIALLSDLQLSEQLRPINEALKAVVASDRELLKRLNPEQREAAEKTFDFLMLPKPAVEPPAKAEPSPSKRRRAPK